MSKGPLLAEDMKRLRGEQESHRTRAGGRRRARGSLSVNNNGSRAAVKCSIG